MIKSYKNLSKKSYKKSETKLLPLFLISFAYSNYSPSYIQTAVSSNSDTDKISETISNLLYTTKGDSKIVLNLNEITQKNHPITLDNILESDFFMYSKCSIETFKNLELDLHGKILKASIAINNEPLESTLNEPLELTLNEPSESTLNELLESTLNEPLESTLNESLESTLNEPLESTLDETFETSSDEALEISAESRLNFSNKNIKNVYNPINQAKLIEDIKEKEVNSIIKLNTINTEILGIQIEEAIAIQKNIFIKNDSHCTILDDIKFVDEKDAIALNNQIATARAIITTVSEGNAENDITEEIVLLASQNLQEAIDNFSRSIKVAGSFDTSNLLLLIEQAIDAMENIQVFDATENQINQGEKFVSSNVANLLSSSIEKAQKAIMDLEKNDANYLINQNLIDNIRTELRRSIDAYNESIQVGTFIDITSLIDEIENAQSSITEVKIIDDIPENITYGLKFVSNIKVNEFEKDIQKANNIARQALLQMDNFNESIDVETEVFIQKQDVNLAISDLKNAINNFYLSIQEGSFVDTSILINSIKTAKLLFQDVLVINSKSESIVPKDIKFVNEKVFNKFCKSLEQAEEVAITDQSSLNRTLDMLEAASQEFKANIKVGNFINTVELDTAISQALSVQTNVHIINKRPEEVYRGVHFTCQTNIDNLNNAIESAKATCKLPCSIQTIDQAVKDLNIATTNFKNAIQVGMIDTASSWDQINEIDTLLENIAVINKSVDTVPADIIFVRSADMSFIENALNYAKKITHNPKSVHEIEEAKNNLAIAYSIFQNSIQHGTLIDTTSLQEKLDEAEKIKFGLLIVNKNKNKNNMAKGIKFVSIDIMQNLDKVIEESQACLQNPENEATIDLQAKKLKHAINTFADFIEEGTFLIDIDVKILTEKINEAQQIMDGILVTDKLADTIYQGMPFVTKKDVENLLAAIQASKLVVENAISNDELKEEAQLLDEAITKFDHEIRYGTFVDTSLLEEEINSAKHAQDWIFVTDKGKDKIAFGIPFVSKNIMKDFEMSIINAEKFLLDARRQADVDGTMHKLNRATQRFYKVIQRGKMINISNLVAEISKANLLKNTVQINDSPAYQVEPDIKFVSEDEMATFENAIDSAQQLVGQYNASSNTSDLEVEILNAVKKLDVARRKFEDSIKTGIFMDNNFLLNEINHAQTLKSNIAVMSEREEDVNFGLQFVDNKTMQKLDKAIKIANSILSKTDDTDLIEIGVLNLKEAITIFKSNIKTGTFLDLTSLINEITNATLIKNSIVIYDGSPHDIESGVRFVSTKTYDHLSKMIILAESAIYDPKSEDFVEKKIYSLKNALNKFNESIMIGLHLNYETLETTIKQAEKMLANIYTSESNFGVPLNSYWLKEEDFDYFFNVVENGKVTLEMAATQNELDDCNKLILKEIENILNVVQLGSGADKSELLQEINAAKNDFNNVKISPNSDNISIFDKYTNKFNWHRLADTISKADTIVKDGNVSTFHVNQTLESLQKNRKNFHDNLAWGTNIDSLKFNDILFDKDVDFDSSSNTIQMLSNEKNINLMIIADDGVIIDNSLTNDKSENGILKFNVDLNNLINDKFILKLSIDQNGQLVKKEIEFKIKKFLDSTVVPDNGLRKAFAKKNPKIAFERDQLNEENKLPKFLSQKSVSISKLKNMTGHLNASNFDISNLAGLEYATELTSIDLSNNNSLTDISILSNLNYNLLDLNLEKNISIVHGLDAIGTLTYLKNLKLDAVLFSEPAIRKILLDSIVKIARFSDSQLTITINSIIMTLNHQQKLKKEIIEELSNQLNPSQMPKIIMEGSSELYIGQNNFQFQIDNFDLAKFVADISNNIITQNMEEVTVVISDNASGQIIDTKTLDVGSYELIFSILGSDNIEKEITVITLNVLPDKNMLSNIISLNTIEENLKDFLDNNLWLIGENDETKQQDKPAIYEIEQQDEPKIYEIEQQDKSEIYEIAQQEEPQIYEVEQIYEKSEQINEVEQIYEKSEQINEVEQIYEEFEKMDEEFKQMYEEFGEIDKEFEQINKEDKVENKILITNKRTEAFEPYAPISRAHVAIMLYELAGVKDTEIKNTNINFKDVPTNDPFAEAISWAVKIGAYNGYEDGTFRPNVEISREQLASVIFNFAKIYGKDSSDIADISSYVDSDQLQDWSAIAFKWAVGNGIIKARNNRLEPTDFATQADVALALNRLHTF
ncbi:MAG: hypothetical protein ATN31_01675 [Candidatus Epulonipiscioides saccharophilum]|nr:MAG: hypothetical protein ATN31_01675 [Epulopiscium sp. AS2M-Bin001]